MPPSSESVAAGDEGATLAGDGVAMAMGALGHHHHVTDTKKEEVSQEGSGHGHEATKGGWVANLYLVLAMVTFAANNSALIWAIKTIGATTCNVLCSAQIVGIVTFGPLFYKDLTWTKIRALRWRDWLAVVVASMARNVVGAYFDVEGMRQTSVPTLAIVEMLEPVEFLLLATCLLPGERRNRWIVTNMGLLVLGVVLGLVLQPALNGGVLPPAKGVAFLIIGGAGYTLAEVIGHIYLDRIPVGIYGMARVVLGTLFYHLLAFLEGDASDRFVGIRNLYSPRLWEQMAWYGFLFVAVGQWLWLNALTRCRPQTITLGTSSLFLLNMAFSAIILGVAPTGAEYVGGAIILVSIGSSLMETRHHERQGDDEEQGSSGGDRWGTTVAEDKAGGGLVIAQEVLITGSRV